MTKRVLAVASGGGHWAQLLRTLPAYEDQEVSFITTQKGTPSPIVGASLYVIADTSRSDPIGVFRCVCETFRIIKKTAPQVIITTGAAPGLIAICLGRVIGARTIWLDSIANAEQLSLSGRLARCAAVLWLTQWPNLARPGGPLFRGSVL